MMLQSYLNEGIGSALYLCPNNYLVKQTISQTKLFAINAMSAESGMPLEFKNSINLSNQL